MEIPDNINSIANNTMILRLAKRRQIKLTVRSVRLLLVEVAILGGEAVGCVEIAGGFGADAVGLLWGCFYAEVGGEGFAF